MGKVLVAALGALALSGCGMTNEQLLTLGETMKAVGAEGQPTPGPMCFLKGQQLSGLYRNCAYSCGGGIVWRTVGAAELCPLSLPSP